MMTSGAGQSRAVSLGLPRGSEPYQVTEQPQDEQSKPDLRVVRGEPRYGRGNALAVGT